MGDDRLFDATPNEFIVQGHCVMVDDAGEICYGGPIRRAPTAAGKLVFLHPIDFDVLRKAVERKRH